MSDLESEICVPCRGGVPPMPAHEAAALLAEVPGRPTTRT